MKFDWKLYMLLLGATLLSILMVMPYAFTLAGDSLADVPVPLPALVLISFVQSAVLFAIVIFLGLLLAKKTGLGVTFLDKWLDGKRPKNIWPMLRISAILGVIAGALIVIADIIFKRLGANITLAGEPPFWMGLLASFYGGIAEEILLRLFLMTLLVWLFIKLPKSIGTWSAIIISTIIFGIGHLPITSSITTLTPLVITRALVLNGIGGLLFGWLYWKKGLESAMVAHFSADIVLHVLVPIFYSGL